MTSKRPVSSTDLALSERLKAAGHQIEPRQLERWRVEGGVVEPSRRPGAFKHARQVIELLDQRLTLQQIAIVQFMRRQHVTTKALKRALRSALTDALGPPTNVGVWTEERKRARIEAEHRTTQLARQPETKRMRKQIQIAAGRPDEKINQAFARVITTVLMLAQAGEAPTRRELRELLIALGLPEDAINLDAIAAQVKRTRRDSLEAALDSASREDLEQARKDHLVAATSLTRRGYSPFGAPETEHDVAFRLLTLLALRKDLGDSQMNHFIHLLESN